IDRNPHTSNCVDLVLAWRFDPVESTDAIEPIVFRRNRLHVFGALYLGELRVALECCIGYRSVDRAWPTRHVACGTWSIVDPVRCYASGSITLGCPAD